MQSISELLHINHFSLSLSVQLQFLFRDQCDFRKTKFILGSKGEMWAKLNPSGYILFTEFSLGMSMPSPPTRESKNMWENAEASITLPYSLYEWNDAGSHFRINYPQSEVNRQRGWRSAGSLVKLPDQAS